MSETTDIRAMRVLFQRRRRHAVKQFGSGCGPSEGYFLDDLALTHLFADLHDVFLSRNNVDDAVGYTSLACELLAQVSNQQPWWQQGDLTSASASAEYGVSGGGLITAVHPAARAAPSFRVIIAEGKFQGVRIDLTPC